MLTIGKISAAVVLAGAAYQDEAGYARMTGLARDKTRMVDDKDGTDTQVCQQIFSMFGTSFFMRIPTASCHLQYHLSGMHLWSALMYVQVHVSWIDSGTAVFAFRGTESTKDGLQDLKFVRRNIDYLQRAYPGAKAHTGAQSMIARHVQCLLRR